MDSKSTAVLEELLDCEAAGRALNKAPRTVRSLVARGLLPVVRIEGTRGLRFRPESVRRLIQDSEISR